MVIWTYLIKGFANWFDYEILCGVCMLGKPGMKRSVGLEKGVTKCISHLELLYQNATGWWLIPQKSVFSHFWRLDVQDQGASRVDFFQGLSHFLVDASFSLCPYITVKKNLLSLPNYQILKYSTEWIKLEEYFLW